MTIVVTGGAGFIGSNFIFYQLKHHKNDKIICIDKITYASDFSTIFPIIRNINFKFYKVDICNKEKIFDIFKLEKPDVVINFAAESHVDRSIKDPSQFLKTNVFGTYILLEACRNFNVARFHQVSTDEVYGDLPKEEIELTFDEKCPIHSNNPYSCTKAAADLLVLAYYRTYNLPISISRCTNNYGPYQNPEKLIPAVICNSIMNNKVYVHGDGTDVRDWIYVEDHCIAIDLIIRKGKVGEIYNVGSHNEKKNIDVVKDIINILNKDFDIIEYTKNRPGQDQRYAINSSKIQKQLKWSTKVGFEEGLKNTINWYIENKNWWYNFLI